MVQRVYATASDLADYAGGELPIDASTGVQMTEQAANALLRRTSQRVDGAIRTAIYETDDNGYPLDADIAQTLEHATCAWAIFFAESGDTTGASGMWTSIANNGASMSGGRGGLDGAFDALTSPEAMQILQDANLTNGRIGRW